MSVGVTISKVDVQGAVLKGQRIKKEVAKILTLKVREDTKRFVPFEQGPLRESAQSLSRPEDGQLIYGGEAKAYVRPQYYGLPGKRTPGTTMRWFEASKAANMGNWERAAKEVASKVAP